MIYIWPSPAKINLFLYITGKRLDGYHNIQTLFQFLDYGDTLKIIPNNKGDIKLFSNKKSLLNIKNSVIQAAQLLKAKALLHNTANSDNFGAKIFLNKRLPIGGGLGGGSSNAATTLIVLNKLWSTKFTLSELSVFGLEIGSDVPGFIMGNTAIVEGIGDILYPIQKQEKWYLVIYPNIPILTKKMFKNSYLVKKKPYKSIESLLNSPFSNDFEEIVKKDFIKIKKLISMLSKYASSRITGTGSCIFSEFNKKTSAQKVLSLLPKEIQGFIAKGVNTSPLHKAIHKKR